MAAPAATPATRIAVLLDITELIAQARQQGAEIGYARLLAALAAERAVIRAVAYVDRDDERLAAALRSQDIEVETSSAPDAVAVAIAVDAMAQVSKVDCVVLAGDSPALAPLCVALRAHGVRVESASFETSSTCDPHHHHQLGRTCLFVP